MKGKKPLVVLVLILALLAVALLMPSVAQAKGPKPTIIVGTSPPYPPYEDYKNANMHKLVGFDIDLVTDIGKRIDCKVEFQVTDFWMLIPDLQSPSARYGSFRLCHPPRARGAHCFLNPVHY